MPLQSTWMLLPINPDFVMTSFLGSNRGDSLRAVGTSGLKGERSSHDEYIRAQSILRAKIEHDVMHRV